MAFVCIPASASETNAVLQQIEVKLRATLSDLQPAAKFEYPEHTQILKGFYLPQKFLVHEPLKPGGVSTNATEQIGPSSNGFVIYFHLQQPGENQLATPQRLRSEHWQTDIDVIVVRGTTNEVFWSLSYGSETDKGLIKRIKDTIKNVGDSKSMFAAPKN